MESLGISQKQASNAMILYGACEVVSRLMTSYLGDKFKGRALHLYVVCTLLLCVQNGIGSMAYTYVHLLVYCASQ